MGIGLGTESPLNSDIVHNTRPTMAAVKAPIGFVVYLDQFNPNAWIFRLLESNRSLTAMAIASLGAVTGKRTYAGGSSTSVVTLCIGLRSLVNY
jgi:hypothetical protein